MSQNPWAGSGRQAGAGAQQPGSQRAGAPQPARQTSAGQTGQTGQTAQTPQSGHATQATQAGQAGQTGQTGQTGQGTQSGQPARRQVSGRLAAQARAVTSSTPRMLRILRGAAAAAALLTGVVATGALSTDGPVGSTPGAVAERWAASERAGVDMAHANQLAAQRVLDGDADDATRTAYDETISSVTVDLGRTGWVPGHSMADSERMNQSWAQFVTGAERAALAGTTGDTASAAAAYAPAAEAGRDAAVAANVVSDGLADSVGLGGGSGLAVVVGTIATLIMAGALVWVALRSRRIVNVPLLVATLITAGLAYSAANPSVVPGDVAARLTSGGQAASALQDVYLARQAQVAIALDQPDQWSDMIARAETTVGALDDENLDQALATLRDQGDAAVQGEAVPTEALVASQQAFGTLETGLRERTDELLTPDAVGGPATLTSGAALLLGLAASVLAWVGLSRRLKDYR